MANAHAPRIDAPPPCDPDTLVRRARLTPMTDGGLRTADLLEQALERDPRHHEAQILRERLHQMTVPRWHFPMLADAVRNRAYAEAIAARVRPGDIVLDIGCGAGLTAMLAARAGARHVYSCEQTPLIARAAEAVIAANGLSDRITVIPKMSHALILGEDLPEPADVVISEIVDTVLLGEGALATLVHAMRALARPGARTVPDWGGLTAQPVQGGALWDLWRPARAEGFDLSAFHGFAGLARLTPNDLAATALRPLAPPQALFTFDFTRPDLAAGRCDTALTCTQAGLAHAVLVSFTLQLAEGIVLGNGLEDGGHWGRTAFLLRRPMPVVPGSALRICAQHDAAQLSLLVEEEGGASGPVACPSPRAAARA
ncbi:50S ribosomal protein L11 methyltransferase [Pseudooceanicola sp. CBS1P-1]|uniref:Methyltransferase domain-containing protein n=1 Tax=Pseudooceanicola albus TaxID=2692189 RepID=A0A6L7G8H0_9RHOB|nr:MULTISPECIES: 50S ribosomal protein L11 methyltransferase [Pseudooceanicola]MBT9382837.1 50S ribosomal protein L11 methyltransferase [Pseudooceanicola endophyticus]MXN20239.1 methyltransferase domain-containing protein [Pseudooceanicola albus]